MGDHHLFFRVAAFLFVLNGSKQRKRFAVNLPKIRLDLNKFSCPAPAKAPSGRDP